MIDHKIDFMINHKIDFMIDHKFDFMIDHRIDLKINFQIDFKIDFLTISTIKIDFFNDILNKNQYSIKNMGGNFWWKRHFTCTIYILIYIVHVIFDLHMFCTDSQMAK